MRVLCSSVFSNIIFVIKDNSNWVLNNRLIDIVFHFKDQADHEQAIDVRVQELSLDPLKNVRHFKRYLVNGYKFWVKVHETMVLPVPTYVLSATVEKKEVNIFKNIIDQVF